MEELTKERIQQIWDYELIKGWEERGKYKMWKVVHEFIKRVKGDNSFDVGFDDLEDYLVSLNLKRCLDIDHQYDQHVFRAWKTDVIGFIHARSESLSMALINDEPKPLILLDIDSYKWTKKNTRASARYRQKQNYIKKSDRATIKIKARSLSKKHDWETVK